MDSDSPLSYEYFYETGGVKVVLFYRTIGPGQSVSTTDWLGIGDEKYEYKLNVTVLVKDYFGSKSIQIMTVQVIQATLKNSIPSLLSYIKLAQVK